MPTRVVDEQGQVWLNGVDRYRVMDPMFEGVRIVLAARGESCSPAYIQGISGSAFRIGGICPCAPTCACAMGPEQLLALLGYSFEKLELAGEGPALQQAKDRTIARIRQEVDAGQPVLVWHAFTNAEWDVVYGYDREKGQFLGRGSYKGNGPEEPFTAAPQERMVQGGDICPSLGVMIVGPRTGTFDAPAAELAALREAVRHGRSQENVDKLGGQGWVMLYGIACYDRWIADWSRPDKKRESGDSYCYNICTSTHRAAADFLREIAPRHAPARQHLLAAADHFQAEADALEAARPMLCWTAPAGPDAERNARLVPLLTTARNHYAAGIAGIESALAALDAATQPASDQP